MSETDVKPGAADRVLPGERGAAGAAGGAKQKNLLVGAGLLCGGLVVIVAVLAGGGGAPKTAVAKPSDRAISTPAPLDELQAAQKAAAAQAAPPKVDGGPYREEKTDAALLASQRAPVIAWQRRGAVGGSSAGGSVPPAGYEGQQRPREDSFENMFKPTVLQGAGASLIQNPDFVVAEGTMIPCVLETALASDQPGFCSCVITHDVLGMTGRVVMLEKGTVVSGQYRGGLNQGQKRLMVLWTNARTPKHVVINLASPGADSLGRAGFDGHVDNHWWERFGSALLLSVVSDAAAIGGQAVKDQFGVSANSTARQPNNAAAMAVEQSGGIKPTLNKNQGEMVAIMLGRNLDFTGIYELRLQRRTVENDWAGEDRGGSRKVSK